MLGQDLLKHKRGYGSYTGSSDPLTLQIFWAGDPGFAQEPLVDPVINGQGDLQRRAALGDSDQGAGAGGGKMDASGNQRLDAGGRFDKDDFEVDPFLAHVTLILGKGINNLLKALGRDCYVDRLQPRHLCC